MERRDFDLTLFFRLTLPLLFLLAVGLAPRPAGLDQTLQQTSQQLRRGDYAAAAQALSGLARQQPWRENLWEEAGRAALNAGDIPDAIAHFEQAYAAHALSADGQVLLGDAYQFTGDQERASAVWQALLDSGAADAPGLYLRLVDNQRQAEDYDGAIATLRALLSTHPEQRDAAYELALLLAATHPEAALPYLEQAGELNPALKARTEALIRSIRSASFEEDPAYQLLASGRELANLQEWRLADLAFARAAETRPDYAEAWAYLGYARERLGEDGDAALDQALALNPDSLAVNLFTAYHFAQAGRPELALLYLHNAAQLDPQRAEIQIELGNLLAEMGDLLSARRHYQRALDMAGSQSEIWRSAAEFAVRYNIDVRELALPAARQAVLLAPDDPAALDTLGQVFFKLGDPLSARRFFLRTLQNDPGYAPGHLHLGLVLLYDGDITAARERFQLVQRLAPDSPAGQQAARLLKDRTP